jgi:hypothetical protein
MVIQAPAARSSSPNQATRSTSTRSNFGKTKAEPQIVKTWAFDSVGNRKYAVQIKKASNGNPCLKLVEGVPQEDGTYRKFSLTIWSEDFHKLFETLEQVKVFMAQNNIRTPEGHKYDPNKKYPRKFARKEQR